MFRCMGIETDRATTSSTLAEMKTQLFTICHIFLSAICEKYFYVVLGGINIGLCCSDTFAKEGNDLLCTYDAACLIHVPTWLTTRSVTSLEICATNMHPHECRSGVLWCDLGDHLPIFFLLPSFAKNKHVSHKRVHFRRIISNEALRIFLRSVESADWNTVYL